ncbi:hypothetical protein MNBD_GAMMA02-1304 [hydrothermal vent metagenome]|uniref:Uncharacterized protein n=1 Tax=hydrothermal vent metagenome TaxID=652676 RepID=A0A3B0VUH7_9ZZZZ
MSEMKVSLSVSKVDFRGNTGDKMQYFYVFSRETCILTKETTSLIFEFSESTSENFKIEKLYFTDDGYKILGKSLIDTNGRAVVISEINKVEKRLVVTSVLCSYTHEKDGKQYTNYLNCDPQVLNDPDIIT